MTNITLSTWDNEFVFAGFISIHEDTPFPANSTSKLPELIDGITLLWNGVNWIIKQPIQTLEEIPIDTGVLQKDFEQSIQELLDNTAKSRGYDNLTTVISYAEEPAVARFQADGQAFRRWRSLVWDYAYTQLNLVLSGERETPTIESFLAELPQLELPT